jgi:hypothetical protein
VQRTQIDTRTKRNEATAALVRKTFTVKSSQLEKMVCQFERLATDLDAFRFEVNLPKPAALPKSHYMPIVIEFSKCALTNK